MTTTQLTEGTQLRINGRRTVYTVTKAMNGMWDIAGPRGGQRALVRNIHSGQITMVWTAGMSAKEQRVETMEVL